MNEEKFRRLEWLADEVNRRTEKPRQRSWRDVRESARQVWDTLNRTFARGQAQRPFDEGTRKQWQAQLERENEIAAACEGKNDLETRRTIIEMVENNARKQLENDTH